MPLAPSLSAMRTVTSSKSAMTPCVLSVRTVGSGTRYASVRMDSICAMTKVSSERQDDRRPAVARSTIRRGAARCDRRAQRMRIGIAADEVAECVGQHLDQRGAVVVVSQLRRDLELH